MKDTFGGIYKNDLAEHGINQKEDFGAFIQTVAKEGKGQGLDVVAKSLHTEGLILGKEEDAAQTLVDMIRNNESFKTEEDVEAELAGKELEHFFNEAKSENAIPEEMTIEEFAQLNQEIEEKKRPIHTDRFVGLKTKHLFCIKQKNN